MSETLVCVYCGRLGHVVEDCQHPSAATYRAWSPAAQAAAQKLADVARTAAGRVAEEERKADQVIADYTAIRDERDTLRAAIVEYVAASDADYPPDLNDRQGRNAWRHRYADAFNALRALASPSLETGK